ncbi:hypothetical protein BUALT_Bualt03G0048800 [Buddleja alternifolia]|uniref:Uncharacterized protein n=1 Tax=Buddleja alternifolia TaxID=168488 RepID=A0AAV6XZH3_9LAMI|nr:hypothetical protein BUALT_Bualt03G0048800 [Buddleja alternifolia]
MAVLSVCDYNGKENIPSSSSTNSIPALPSNKKRKLRMPLEDITNLVYPGTGGRMPSLQENAVVLHTSSLFLRTPSVRQPQKRFRRTDASSSFNTSTAATLRKHFR